jgi:pathogenesis-related protein 1
LWVNEKKDYHGQPLCAPSSPGDPVIGHYTQMVWNTTKEVGCGFASGPGGVFANSGGTGILVCQYNPPGNIFGQKPF